MRQTSWLGGLRWPSGRVFLELSLEPSWQQMKWAETIEDTKQVPNEMAAGFRGVSLKFFGAESMTEGIQILNDPG